MKCPFLKEAEVKSCIASPYKKMILRTGGLENQERCSSNDWILCPAAKSEYQDHKDTNHCPFLHESLVQSCSATPTSKLIPYSESVLSRCGTESHLYCEAFLSMAGPEEELERHDREYDLPETDSLFHSRNHMWIRIHEDGSCHIGIDRFLATLLRHVETLSFVTTKSFCFPTVVLRVRGVDLQLVFPHRIELISVNSYLRARPSRVTSHPYTLGWLFEGKNPGIFSTRGNVPTQSGLIRGHRATKWIDRESIRLADYVRNEILSARSNEFSTMLDGGMVSEDLIAHLTREEMLQLFNEFFSPSANVRLLSPTYLD